MPVQVEIVAVGDELCYGRVYDTNSFWIADQVTRLGALVQRITCVRDDADGIRSVLGEALGRRPHFIFVTGGLGPTPDDRTLEALSRLTNRRIAAQPAILQRISERRGVPVSALPPHFAAMTSSLEGAECLPNPVGIAPITIVQVGETLIAAMPGPPREVQACFTEHLARRVQEKTRYHSLARRITVTMVESEVSPLIAEVTKATPGVYMKPLVGEYRRGVGLPVEVIAFGESAEACRNKYEEAVRMLERLVVESGREVMVNTTES